MKYIPLLIFIFQGVSCIETNSPEDISYYTKVVSESKSPDGKRILKLTEFGYDTINCCTQVTIDFEGGSTGVYSTNGRNLAIKTRWKNNKTIIIETKKEYLAPHQKWKQVQHFSDIVKVEYIEK